MIQSAMNEILFRDLRIEHICKPSLKNSYISVKHDAKIILKTPKVSSRYIQELLYEKESWIRKQLTKLEQNPPQKLNLEDEVLLFGEIYSIDSQETLELNNLLQKIKVGDSKKTSDAYNKFYKNLAKEYLTPRLQHHAKIMNLNYTEIKFRKMRSRWGSCSSNGVITLNTELIKIKKSLSEYVLVHELAHLVHMNHSKSFHNLVEKYLPNAKVFRKELKLITIR